MWQRIKRRMMCRAAVWRRAIRFSVPSMPPHLPDGDHHVLTSSGTRLILRGRRATTLEMSHLGFSLIIQAYRQIETVSRGSLSAQPLVNGGCRTSSTPGGNEMSGCGNEQKPNRKQSRIQPAVSTSLPAASEGGRFYQRPPTIWLEVCPTHTTYRSSTRVDARQTII